jgi:hypothetical protein
MAAALTVAGCATIPACPEKGGPEWLELTTAHFRVRSDLDRDDAEEVARGFEELRASELELIWPGEPGPPLRIEVIALRSAPEFQAYMNMEEAHAVSVKLPPLDPLIVTAGYFDRGVQQQVAHELAHQLSAWFLPTQPLWYAEGVATFIETMTYDRAAKRAQVGDASMLRILELRARGIMPSSKLLSARDSSSWLESSAWLLFHYLIDKHPREFVQLQLRLGLLQSSESVWQAVFPDLPPERLDAELKKYWRAGRLLGGQRSLTVPEASATTRTLTDAEVHALRAVLYQSLPGAPDARQKARAEVQEALVHERSNVEALAIEFYGHTKSDDLSTRAELARRAVGGHGDQWLAWVMAADASATPADRRTALARAIGSAAHTRQAMARLAVLDAVEGRWAEGEPLSREALRLGLRDPALILAHIENLAHTGRCHDAGLLAALFAAGVDPAAAKTITTRWSELEQICSGGATTAEPGQ